MGERDLFLIAEIPGFTPQIGRLVSMMNYVRSTTLSAVAGLGVDELDYLHDPQSNSIGALLLHIAAAEVGYQAATFDGRGLDDEERHEWGAALDLGDRARREIKGHDLDYYVTRLEHVREKTLVELGRRTDAWLEEWTSSGSGQRVNNHFKWFHVFGHEINHRGQIRWLRARATIMIRQIAPQFFTVDLPATLRYYKDKLGFDCVSTWQDPPVYAIVARDQHRIHFRCAEPPAPNPDKYDDELLDAYLFIDDADALYAEYAGRGVEFTRALGNTPWRSREFVVKDCDGRLLAFGAHPD